MDILTHVSSVRGAQARGLEIGSTFAAQIRDAADRYHAFFTLRGLPEATVREIAQNSLAALQDWCPRLATELVATAAGAGVETWRLAALNARTEVLAAIGPDSEGECSTMVYAPEGSEPETMQTWDWHADLCPTGLVIEFVPGDDDASTHHLVTRVRLFTELGVLGKIGVNDAGLGVHFNILHHASDRPTGGVPVHAVARRILEEARSLEEAETIARSARVSASTVITVAVNSASGQRAASLELSPAGVATVLPDHDGWLLHTNHYLDPVLVGGEATRDPSTTYARYDHLRSRVPMLAHLPVRERAAQFAGPKGALAPVCFTPNPADPPHEQWTTLLTISLELAAGRLSYAPANPQTRALFVPVFY